MEEYVIINIKSVSFALPCVCSPVEAGEVKTIEVYKSRSDFSRTNIRIGVPSNPNDFLKVFSKKRLYEKCISSELFTKNTNDGGHTPSCTA